MIRLDKYLADMGAGTRQEVKKMIRQGKVLVDGKKEKRPETKINEESQTVVVNGKTVDYRRYEYYMLNKPAGVVSATEDSREKTVLELIGGKKRKDLFPVGRLDKDTEGLLLITNDGELAHRLLSPRHHVDKCYYAQVRGTVTVEDVKSFGQGINIGVAGKEEWTKPGELVILESGDVSKIRLTIREGKYHQIKRMFQAVGKEVVYLKRERMGSLVLDERMEPGEYRELTDEEICELRKEG